MDDEFKEEFDAELRTWIKRTEEAEALVKELIDGGVGEGEARKIIREKYRDLGAVRPKKDGASFSREQAREGDDVPLLSKGAPYDTAKEFVRRRCFKDGVLATYYWNEDFWEWNGRCYEKVSGESLNKEMFDFLDGARTLISGDAARFRPAPSDVEKVIKCLRAGLTIVFDPPCWTDGKRADRLIVFKNGIVDVDMGELMPPSPKLWSHTALEFDYDPEARCPTWERFLGEVFEGDPETVECIEEQLGLGMVDDVRFQKGFLWIGPQGREGKGTLTRILAKLVGATAYVSLTFHNWLKGEHSAEALLGKRVGVFADVRLKEGKWYGQNFDPGGLDHTSIEWLLRITGGDPVTIARKYIGPWRGTLPMRVTLISNDVPNLNDSHLVKRFVKIAFNVSFRDREDLTLADRLITELPGIAVRCLAGYRRLCRRGRFIQPASGLKLARELAAKSNVWQGFFDDVFLLDREGMVTFGMLWTKFQWWCEENRRMDLLRKVTQPSHLTRVLNKEVSAFRHLQEYRPDGGKRHLLGIKLRKAGEIDDGVDLVSDNPPNPPKTPIIPFRLSAKGFKRRI
jgi:putative DNA primase/helicase